MTDNMTSIPDDGAKEGIICVLSQSIDSWRVWGQISSMDGSLIEAFYAVPVLGRKVPHQAGEAYVSRASIVARSTSWRSGAGIQRDYLLLLLSGGS